jgi:hypothetical protein
MEYKPFFSEAPAGIRSSLVKFALTFVRLPARRGKPTELQKGNGAKVKGGHKCRNAENAENATLTPPLTTLHKAKIYKQGRAK